MNKLSVKLRHLTKKELISISKKVCNENLTKLKKFDIIEELLYKFDDNYRDDFYDLNIDSYELELIIDNVIKLRHIETGDIFVFDFLLDKGGYGHILSSTDHPNFPFVIKRNKHYKCSKNQYETEEECVDNNGEWYNEKIRDSREISAIKDLEQTNNCDVVKARLLPSSENPEVILMRRADGNLKRYLNNHRMDLYTDSAYKNNQLLFNNIVKQLFNILKCLTENSFIYTALKLSNILYTINSYTGDIDLFLGDLGGFCKRQKAKNDTFIYEKSGTYTYGSGKCTIPVMSWLFCLLVVNTFVILYDIDKDYIPRNWLSNFRFTSDDDNMYEILEDIRKQSSYYSIAGNSILRVCILYMQSYPPNHNIFNETIKEGYRKIGKMNENYLYIDTDFDF